MKERLRKIVIKGVVRLERIILCKPVLNFIVWVIACSVPDEVSYDIFNRHGYYLFRKYFHIAVPDEDDLLHIRDSGLVGIDMNENHALSLVGSIFDQYKKEFNSFPVHETGDPLQYYLLNGSYMAIDGNVYYSFIRHMKPRRIVEIGSGNSTRLAAAAIRKNVAEGAKATELICIEPYLHQDLKEIPEITRLITDKVQDVSIDFFKELQSGDILFIDSTHTVRPGGDVWWEYCEILPRLNPGVLIHIHDISLPKPYPKVYLKRHWYWMEQYLLQALLTFSNHFEVLWPGNYLMAKYPDKIKSAFSPELELMRSEFASADPGSFWMKVR